MPVLGLEGEIVETAEGFALDDDGATPRVTHASGPGTIVRVRDLDGVEHDAGALYRAWVTRMHASDLLPADAPCISTPSSPWPGLTKSPSSISVKTPPRLNCGATVGATR